MEEAEWVEFFRLLRKVVGMRNLSWREKADLVTSMAEKHSNSPSDVGEFSSWFEEDEV